MDPQPYLDVLELSDVCSWQEVLDAYNEKLDLLHPIAKDSEEDLNNLLALSLSFEFMAGYKLFMVFEPDEGDFRKLTKKEWNRWESLFMERNEEMDKRMREYAGMSLEDFKKTDFYSKSQHLFTKEDYSTGVITIALLLLVPVASFFVLGFFGLNLTLLGMVLSISYWREELTKLFALKLSALKQGLVWMVNAPGFWAILFGLGNLLIFVFLTTRTFIPFIPLLVFLGVTIVLGLILPLQRIALFKRLNRGIAAVGLTPLLLNLFFGFNYTFSQPLIEERHYFRRGTEMNYSEFSSDITEGFSSTIILRNDLYEQYFHIRSFAIEEQLEEKHSITMNIHSGLFGFRVLKSWTLHELDWNPNKKR